jgi:hypothetical protein
MSDDQAKDLESARAQVAVLREALEKVDEIACRSGGGSAGPEPEAPEPINPDGQELSYLARAALASSASSAAEFRAKVFEEGRKAQMGADFATPCPKCGAVVEDAEKEIAAYRAEIEAAAIEKAAAFVEALVRYPKALRGYKLNDSRDGFRNIADHIRALAKSEEK